MFEQLRRSLEDMLNRAIKPEERREVVARMKTTLVQARLGLDDLRDALAKTQRKLEHERKELATVKRRKEMAVGINDAETVKIAERFEQQHGQLVTILEEKVAVQTREVELAEREVEEMKAEIRQAMIGSPSAGAAPGTMPLDEAAEDPLADEQDTKLREDFDALARERARTMRDDDAAKRLEELKRRMGK